MFYKVERERDGDWVRERDNERGKRRNIHYVRAFFCISFPQIFYAPSSEQGKAKEE